MMIDDMDEEELVRQLIEHVAATSDILETFGFDFWSSWLREDIIRIRRFDVSGLEHLLSAFGGMGSINDVRLDAGPPSVAIDPNLQLQRHLSEIFNLASSLVPDSGR